MIWQIRQLHVRIVIQHSFLQKMNKHFTRKKVLKMNLKDVLIAEQQESSKEETTTEVETETLAAAEIEIISVAAIDGKIKGEF